MEAVILGVPSIAFSLDSPKNHLTLMNYEAASLVTEMVVSNFIDHRIPKGVLLNVNIAHLPFEEINGFRSSLQRLRVVHDRLKTRLDPSGRAYYWIGGDIPIGIREDDTDIGAIQDGYVSITPLQLDLTAYPALQLVNRWKWKSMEAHPLQISEKVKL